MTGSTSTAGLSHRPPSGRAADVTAEAWERAAGEALAARPRARCSASGARPSARPHGAARRRRRPAGRILSFDCPRGHFPSVGRLHAPAQRLERALRTSSAWCRRRRGRHAALARPRPLGRHAPPRRRRAAARRRGPTPSCRSRARACTRSRSARCMPASSSPAISASPPRARRWCGSRSGSATPTRASRG